MSKEYFKRFKGLTLISLGTIVPSVISAVFWLYLARLVGAENYGEITYYLAIAGITVGISFLGAGNTLTVYTAKGSKIQPTIYFVVIISSLIAAIVLFFITWNVYACINVVGNILFSLVTFELLGTKHYKKWAVLQISQKIIMVVLSVILYHSLGINGVILGIGLSYFPMSVIHTIGLFRKQNIDFNLMRERVGFITNSYAMDLARYAGSSIDKIIVAPLFGFALLGNYQLGLQVLSILGILPGILYQYILPHDVSGTSNKKLKFLAVGMSFVFATLAVMLAPIIIPILFQKFTESVQVIQIVSITVIPSTINIIYISQFLANEKSRIVLIGSVIFVVIQISLIMILGKIFGMNGVAASLVFAGVAETIYYASTYLYEKRNG